MNLNDDPAHQAPLSDADAERIALSLIRLNRNLGQRLGQGIFEAPALMILLELLVASFDKRRLTIKSAALASGVPMSTALRWIDRLEQHGHIVRRDNPADRRSAHVALTPEAAAALRTLLDQSRTMPGR